jgi:hypothetical protein
VLSVRLAPPSTILPTLRSPARSTSSLTEPVRPGVITTTTSSISGAPSNTAMACSRIVLPATVASCFGVPSPTRLPTPPAKTTPTERNRESILGA